MAEIENKTKKERKCGVLVHPTSFDSPYGIGDLGAEARAFIDNISGYGIKLWQILPLGPTGYGDSPYSSRSCFAGNEYLIDLRSIDGISCNYEDTSDRHSRVDYNYVANVKMKYLIDAATRFYKENKDNPSFVSFCSNNSWWLDDYSLFQTLAHHLGTSCWFNWERGIKMRDKDSLDFWKNALEQDINVYKTLQFIFRKQWDSLHSYANSKGVKIVGDIPIFAAGDSADVWSNPELFKLDENLNQTAGAGVPPDAFSPDGQYWGNPVYDWDVHRKDDFSWWVKRVSFTFELVDYVRIDHFRGFESYWEVPANSDTAAAGHWEKGPGMDLIGKFAGLNIIAEDLGVITPQVEKLLSDSKFPGMKVLQFAFDPVDGYPKSDNYYLPFNIDRNCVAYTGTHDNNTTRGWYNELPDYFKDMIRRFFECSDEEVVWQMIRTIIACRADTVVIPLQDIIGLDADGRMNKPATVGTCNWSWRFNHSLLEPWMLNRLGQYIKLYGRN